MMAIGDGLMRVKTAKDLGNVVHDRRKALGMTQAELAARVGVSRLWVNQVESGHGGAAMAKVLQLLSALDLTMNLDAQGPSVVVEHHASRSVPMRATARTTRVERGTAGKMAMPKARPVGKKDR